MSGLSYKVVTGVALACAACSLDVTGTGSLDLGSSGSAGVDASAPDNAKTTTSADAASTDAALPTDEAGQDATAADAAPPDCDLDNDGHNAKACGGDDCCDNDARTHPGASDYFDTADACGKFDYDCDGKESHQYGKSTPCDQAIICADPGFVIDTACGVNAAFKTCNWALGCHPGDTMKTQACR